jgi:hypothetical protein
MNTPEELDALLDIYLFAEIDDEEALDILLEADRIDYNSFRDKIEEALFHLNTRDEEGVRPIK